MVYPEYDEACDILELPRKFTQNELKQAYRKKALKYHPDKNKDKDSTEKFQKISVAYEFLSNCQDEDIDDQMFSGYNNIMKNFIRYFNKDIDPELVMSIVNKLASKVYSNVIDIFGDCDKDTVVHIYELIVKYKDIFQIDQDIIDQVERIVREKTSDDNLIIINPTMQDLFKANVFKIERSGEQYYVPLWHDEVYFENKTDDADLIVKCIPILPDHITVDENNNIHINVVHKCNMRELLEKESIKYAYYDDSDKLIDLNIAISSLYIRKSQTIKFFKNGIPKINQSDMYSINNKSDLIVHLELIY